MKTSNIILIIILLFPIFGLNSRSVVVDLDLIKLESTSEVSSLRSSKSTDKITLDQSFDNIELQEMPLKPYYHKSKISAGPVSVACVFAPGGLGDNSFNDMAYAGLQKAESDGLCTFIYSEPASEGEGNSSLFTYAEAGTYDLIIAIGFMYNDSVNHTATDYPNQAILNIDSPVVRGNVSSTLFKHHEGSFLAGALAGLMTNTGRIGFIGGMDIPLIREFWAGYSAGAFYEKNNSYIEVFDEYVGAFDQPAIAKSQAENMWRKGVDIIFAAAGYSGDGVLEFASENPGVYAIGVDADQDWIQPGDILTSMMKRVDIAVYRGIQDIYNGNWVASTESLGLVEDGVGLSPMHFTKDLIGEEIIEEVNVTVRNKIIGGAITAPNDTIRLNQWLATMGIANKSYTYNASFSITSDTQFGPSGYDFPGSGSSTDPYNITGLYINATSGNLIFISDTTLYFRIENCLLNGLSTTTTQGINLQNVQNGAIVNTTVCNMGNDGISLGDPLASHYINITDNIVFNNRANGIFLKYSTNNYIINNTVFNNTYKGIRLEYSFYNYLVDNVVYDNNEDGIFFLYSDFCSADGNTVWNSGGNGIHLGYSNNSWINDNLVFENGQSGISSEYAKKNTILSNEAFLNGWMGITTHYSTNHTVNYNIAKENQADGLSFYFSTDMKVINNTAIENKFNGIRLESLAHNNSIINSTIIGNGEGGIWLGYACKDNNVSFNSVSYNNGSGINLLSDYNNPPVGTNNNYIGNNTVFGNQYAGIHLKTESDYNTIINNVVFDNGGNGINIEDSRNNNITYNIAYDNIGDGLGLSNSSNIVISHNIAYNNTWCGIRVQQYSTKNTIYKNTIYNSRGSGMIFLESNYTDIIENTCFNNSIIAGESSDPSDDQSSGISLAVCVHSQLINNNVSSNFFNGILIWRSEYVNITENIVEKNDWHGIRLGGETSLTVNNTYLSQNTIQGNKHSGISMNYAIFNVIQDNRIIGNIEDGFFISNSNNNEFIDNIVSGNTQIGFRLYESANLNYFFSNTVNNSGASGISLLNSFNNTFIENTIHNNDIGIFLENSASNNWFENNIIFRNSGSGIYVMNGQSNTILSNTIYEHTGYGLVIGSGCDGNLVKWNDYIRNNLAGESQAEDDGDSTFTENFWDEWTSPDADNDGFVDNPYDLAGGAENGDGFPLTIPRNPSRFHFISRFSISFPSGGEALVGSVTIQWTFPLDSLEHTIFFNVYYSYDGGTVWSVLASDLVVDKFDWDTTTVLDTNYLIKIEAKDSTGLMSVAISNTFEIQNTPTTTVVPTTTTNDQSEPTTEPTTTTIQTIGGTPGFSSFIAVLTVLGLVLVRYRRAIKDRK
jgi:basic membrane protein A